MEVTNIATSRIDYYFFLRFFPRITAIIPEDPANSEPNRPMFVISPVCGELLDGPVLFGFEVVIPPLLGLLGVSGFSDEEDDEEVDEACKQSKKEEDDEEELDEEVIFETDMFKIE